MTKNEKKTLKKYRDKLEDLVEEMQRLMDNEDERTEFVDALESVQGDVYNAQLAAEEWL